MRRDEARYCEQSRERWSLTGRTSVSSWRWLRDDLTRDPVQVLRALFWRVCKDLMLEGETLGNQTGQA